MHRRTIVLLSFFVCAVFSFSAHAKSKKSKRVAADTEETNAVQQDKTAGPVRRQVPVPCPMSARALEGNPGDTQVILCPAQCMGPLVWGTDVYADDSAICVAARHAGVYDGEEDTFVLLEFLPGQKGYRGSEKHGITTHHWGTWPRSFAVHALNAGTSARSMRSRSAAEDQPQVAAAPFGIRAASAPVEEDNKVGRNQAVDCSLRGDELPGNVGTRHTIRCPSGCNTERVWGSGPYTDDSSVCAAAIHAGAIPLNEGGLVRVVKEGPLKNAKASAAHGVESQAWRYWPRSFRVEKPR